MERIDQDCKFYYTSSCSKRGCPFRHEPAALKCYVTCSYWRKGKCRKLHCEFRHIELNRKEIPCYWEKQPEGCQKDDCPFLHSIFRIAGGHRPVPMFTDGDPLRLAPRARHLRESSQQDSISLPSNKATRQRGQQTDRKVGSAQKEMSRAQSVPRSPGSNLPWRREKSPSRGASARSTSQDNKSGEKKLRKKLKEMERKLREKEEEKERVLKQHQEELDSHTSFTLQALQDELEASVNASTTCMTATEDIIRSVGSTMREEFECKICYELFITPTTLNCSHSFCEFCINQWRTHSSNCPQCRQVITSQTRARAIENFIERMISNLTEDLKERRKELIKGRLISTN